jgi:hypothetical protein
MRDYQPSFGDQAAVRSSGVREFWSSGAWARLFNDLRSRLEYARPRTSLDYEGLVGDAKQLLNTIRDTAGSTATAASADGSQSLRMRTNAQLLQGASGASKNP